MSEGSEGVMEARVSEERGQQRVGPIPSGWEDSGMPTDRTNDADAEQSSPGKDPPVVPLSARLAIIARFVLVASGALALTGAIWGAWPFDQGLDASLEGAADGAVRFLREGLAAVLMIGWLCRNRFLLVVAVGLIAWLSRDKISAWVEGLF